jgi:simple sugar transport system substrate-binding protein
MDPDPRRGGAVSRALLVLLVLALAGCGGSTTVREPDIVVRGDRAVPARPSPEPTPAGGRGLRVAAVRIAVVSHGQASDPFWAIVKRGVDDAARQTGIAVSYRAPDSYDVARMGRMIDEAISARLDGLVVSLPDVRALRAPIRRAERAGIPVISINSGSDRFRRLGILAHVGQPEWRAGYESGRRMAAAGVRDALCVNQEEGNAGLELRCRAFAAGRRRGGGRSSELVVDLQDPDQAQQRIARAVRGSTVDGVLTLGPGGAAPALKAIGGGGFGRRVRLATFDLSPEVLQAVRARRMLFAVDQQPYLQGYMPVVMLAERARHLLSPARGELIPTGPEFVTPRTAGRVLELSRRGFR